MNTLQSSLRRALIWLAPVRAARAACSRGRPTGAARSARPPAAETRAGAAAADASRCCPSIGPPRRPTGSSDAVERTLFNPTRRPAPVRGRGETSSRRMQRGQFALSGTLVVDGKATAFLREVQGGKSRRVAQGETVNGMMVAGDQRRPRAA